MQIGTVWPYIAVAVVALAIGGLIVGLAATWDHVDRSRFTYVSGGQGAGSWDTVGSVRIHQDGRVREFRFPYSNVHVEVGVDDDDSPSERCEVEDDGGDGYIVRANGGPDGVYIILVDLDGLTCLEAYESRLR